MIAIDQLAKRHYDAGPKKYCLAGFVSTVHGVTIREIQLIARGLRRPSYRVLLNFHQAHVRIFPGDTVIVPVADHAQATLGAEGLSITFTPQSTNP